MKNFKSLLIIALFALLLVACEKEENKVTYLGNTAPVLSVSSSTDLVLTKAKENFSSLQFQWTNPNYEFTNGTNTQDVYYTLQIDTTGSGFTNPKKASIAFTKDVSTSFTVKALNNTLSGLELKDFIAHAFEFRIKANFSNGALPVYSNVVKIKITTYLDVVYPVPSNLYIIGDATANEWNNNSKVLNDSYKFRVINTYTFQIDKIALVGGKDFLFLPLAGSWDHKYAFGTEDAQKYKNNKEGDVFTYDGKHNFKAPDASGDYKVVVNFKTAKYSLEKL